MTVDVRLENDITVRFISEEDDPIRKVKILKRKPEEEKELCVIFSDCIFLKLGGGPLAGKQMQKVSNLNNREKRDLLNSMRFRALHVFTKTKRLEIGSL